LLVKILFPSSLVLYAQSSQISTPNSFAYLANSKVTSFGLTVAVVGEKRAFL